MAFSVTRASVEAALDAVMDPELDEAVTDLGFIEDVAIEGGHVGIAFRLPTYWCSPSFAFLMVEDIHRAVAAMPGVAAVDVRLLDHLYGEEIADAVRSGRSFEDALGAEFAGDNIAALRLAFQDKAFQRRQEAVLLDLKRQGIGDVAIVSMTLADFDAARFEAEDARRRAPLYRSLLVERGLAVGPQDTAFVTLCGARIEADALQGHLRTLRQVRINMEFGGALCRGLKRARYKEAVRQEDGLTIVDFLPGSATSEATDRAPSNPSKTPATTS